MRSDRKSLIKLNLLDSSPVEIIELYFICGVFYTYKIGFNIVIINIFDWNMHKKLLILYSV